MPYIDPGEIGKYFTSLFPESSGIWLASWSTAMLFPLSLISTVQDGPILVYQNPKGTSLFSAIYRGGLYCNLPVFLPRPMPGQIFPPNLWRGPRCRCLRGETLTHCAPDPGSAFPFKGNFLVFQANLHPGRLTWNLKITQLKRKIIFQSIIFRFHVNLPFANLFSGAMAVSSREGRT